MVLGEIFDTAARHLEKNKTGRRALVKVESTKFTLVHSGGSLVVGHENKTAELRPGVDGFLDGTHHPRGEATALEGLENEDVGEVSKGNVVGNKTGEADKGEVGERGVAGEAAIVCKLSC